MQKLLIVIAAATLAGGCKKKSNESTSGSGGSGATGGGAGTASGAAGGDGTQSATTESMGDLKPVSECPPALKDTDKGLRRTIPAGCQTKVEGDYYVDGELVVEAGATLAFAPGAAMYVAYSAPGKLVVRGTKEQPVTFTSGGDKAAGAWKGVTIYARAPRSELNGIVIEHAQVALASEAPELTVKDSTFRDNQEASVRLEDQATFAAFAGNTFEKPGELAMSVPPAALGGVGANTFPADAAIELRGGAAKKSATWANPGAPFKVTGEVYIEGAPSRAKVVIAAGNRFLMDGGAAIYVGYASEGELEVAGTKEAPVSFASAGAAEPGAWERGIISYSRGVLTMEHVVVRHGGGDDKAAVRVESGKLSMTSSTLADNVIGLHVDDSGELRAFDHNQLAGNRERALELAPRALGVLGAANTYAAGEKILVHGGKVEKPATWLEQPGAAVTIDGEIYIDGGQVTIPAGATYTFTDAGVIYVGYSQEGKLQAVGTAARPITFQGTRDDAGAWKGIELYGRSSGSTLEHVKVKGATLRTSDDAKVKLTSVTCAPEKC
ncbi:MAG: hypothetical protein K8M05_35285 [Deltaproteobacteria bacterium]|nr:hypothetical protein [Kofleriaceae bacterium]